jgi:hypothetical protein
MGVSFVGKPTHPDDKPPKNVKFTNKEMLRWRDEMLAWPKGLAIANAGHDFFYVQQVRFLVYCGFE